jgi:hypothetical protein
VSTNSVLDDPVNSVKCDGCGAAMILTNKAKEFIRHGIKEFLNNIPREQGGVPLVTIRGLYCPTCHPERAEQMEILRKCGEFPSDHVPHTNC